jgi:ABC-2 type transport system permease protein
LKLAWVDLDHSSASTSLRADFVAVPGVILTDQDLASAQAEMKTGAFDGILEVPQGYGAAVATATAPGAVPATPATITVYTDPARAATAGVIQQVVGSVLGTVNLGGKPPIVAAEVTSIQTQSLSTISYLVPSILGMALMQLGVFAAVPLVADRQKMILKRLNATPLHRWQLVGSNIVMRLMIGILQAIIIVAVGTALFGMQVTGSLIQVAVLVVLGALAFLSLGYVIASFAPTEDAANGMTSVVQFPLMFLSGTFFVIDQMPQPLQVVARFLPLTYLSDALRQVMVNGTAFSPLWFCFAVLVVWTVVCFGISARFFKWQ